MSVERINAMKLRRTTAKEHEEHLCEARVRAYSTFYGEYGWYSCDRPATWKGKNNYYCGLCRPGRRVRK